VRKPSRKILTEKFGRHLESLGREDPAETEIGYFTDEQEVLGRPTRQISFHYIRYSKDHTENIAFKRSSVVACVFVDAQKVFPSRCLPAVSLLAPLFRLSGVIGVYRPQASFHCFKIRKIV
jgi:hypothetical protein